MLETLRHFFHREQNSLSCNQKLVFHDIIASGTFGKVYEGEFFLCNEAIPVAIKKIKLKKSLHSSELHNLIELRDEHDIVHLYSYTEKHNYGIFVVELCCGGDLMDYLLKRMKAVDFSIPEATCAHIIDWLLRALDKCHQHGIMHGDVKLENIGLKKRNDLNELRLLDLGNSRELNRSYCKADLIGSPHYTAPELLTSGIISDPTKLKSIDIWCVGVVAFVLIEQEYPGNLLSFTKASPLCRDFISTLLSVYSKRPLFDTCISHEWLKKFK